MTDKWKKELSCAIQCTRCNAPLQTNTKRILSVYDSQAICMACKKEEESRADYPETSQKMIGNCMAETEVLYSDPGGYCYYHFYPFTCK